MKFSDWLKIKLGITDISGRPVTIKWFIKWKIAEWCIKKWMQYEGLPTKAYITSTRVVYYGHSGKIISFFEW